MTPVRARCVLAATRNDSGQLARRVRLGAGRRDLSKPLRFQAENRSAEFLIFGATGAIASGTGRRQAALTCRVSSRPSASISRCAARRTCSLACASANTTELRARHDTRRSARRHSQAPIAKRGAKIFSLRDCGDNRPPAPRRPRLARRSVTQGFFRPVDPRILAPEPSRVSRSLPTLQTEPLEEAHGDR
jgi:hypothetical protein